MPVLRGYIGTYASERSKGVYRFEFNTEDGTLSEPELFIEARNAKCVALSNAMLAAPVQCGGAAGVILVDTNDPAESKTLLPESRTACYMDFGGTLLYAANYHEGTVAVYETLGGLELLHKIKISPKAGCHQTLLHGRFLLVPCLELDRIELFDTSRNYTHAGEIQFPAGAGPRHCVFTKSHDALYVVTERSNEVFRFTVGKDANFTFDSACPVFSAKMTADSTSAAIRLSNDGRFLYVSTRGADVLTVFSTEGPMRAVQQLPCGGEHPRDFILSPDGNFLIVLNRYSGNIVAFRLHPDTGRIGEICSKTSVFQGSGLVL